MNEIMNESFLRFIRASLGTDDMPTLSENDCIFLYNEFKMHAIIGLPAKILSQINKIPAEMKQTWEKDIYGLVYRYYQYIKHQNEVISILHSNYIQFVILKGTAASQYYDNPELRTMGDIDIMPKRGQFSKTCEVLKEAGYREMSYSPPYKCMELCKGNIIIEVHRYFAKMNEPQKAEYLDATINDNITLEKIYLDDPINGLVLLQHIDHHLENGIGLRQIVDWFMFSQKYLSDKNWETTFCSLVNNLGLEKLAITLTRMCQIYFGLDSRINWCCSADENLCDSLMNFILDSGNFGNKYQQQEFAVQRTFFDLRHPIRFFAKLQKYGKSRLKRDQVTCWPSFFAWCYQLKYSIAQLFDHHISLRKILKQAKQSARKKHMLDKLGVKQDIKGLAIYADGKFIKEKIRR